MDHSKPIVYLDGSSLLRNNSIKYLSQNFTRKNFVNNPNKFILNLNKSLEYNKLNEQKYHNLLLYLLNNSYIDYIITMDFTFYSYENNNIINLFGNIKNNLPISQNDILTNNICLFNENIAFEKYKSCYSILKEDYFIIIDDSFLSLEVGRTLLCKTKSNSIVRLSEIASEVNAFSIKAESFYSILINCFNIPIQSLMIL